MPSSIICAFGVTTVCTIQDFTVRLPTKGVLVMELTTHLPELSRGHVDLRRCSLRSCRKISPSGGGALLFIQYLLQYANFFHPLNLITTVVTSALEGSTLCAVKIIPVRQYSRLRFGLNTPSWYFTSDLIDFYTNLQMISPFVLWSFRGSYVSLQSNVFFPIR